MKEQYLDPMKKSFVERRVSKRRVVACSSDARSIMSDQKLDAPTTTTGLTRRRRVRFGASALARTMAAAVGFTTTAAATATVDSDGGWRRRSTMRVDELRARQSVGLVVSRTHHVQTTDRVVTSCRQQQQQSDTPTDTKIVATCHSHLTLVCTHPTRRR